MNAILLGAASLGALITYFTQAPSGDEALRAAADDAEVARLMQAAPDAGAVAEVILVDPENGAATRVQTLSFRD